MKDVPSSVFQEMIDTACLPAEETARRVSLALAPGYWDGLTPAPSQSTPSTSHRASVAPIQDALASFAHEGILHVRGAAPPEMVRILNTRIDAVVHAGWPAVFAFVYDEPWALVRSSPFSELVEGAVGGRAAQIPDVWTHIVRPSLGNAGWPPHTHGGGSQRLTLWIALTEATIENGCMYAVAREGKGQKEAGLSQAALTRAEVAGLLQRARALPADAGDVLGWAYDILHWGSVVHRETLERRSLSLEFIAEGATPTDDELPLLALNALPPFEIRLRAIGSALLAHRNREPQVARYRQVGEKFLSLRI
jgi:hypothetical protein